MLLETIAVDYWLLPIRPEQMPFLAAELLADGHDAPALRQVASLTAHDDPRDIRDAFRQALEELGAWLPDPPRAQARAAESAARDLVAGRTSIEECARRLRDIFEFDEVVYSSMPPDLYELVLLSWLIQGEEYGNVGGDDGLLRAARSVATS